MVDLISRFPEWWRTAVVVLRGGGRDQFGDPQEPVEHEVPDCLVAPRATHEPASNADLVESTAVLYRTVDDGFVFFSTDRVVVPDGQRMSGEWAVSGLASEWPFGHEVPLKRV